MYSPDFDYYRASSVAEAGDLLRKHPGAKILAGGHSLIPLLKFRLAAPPALIDIGRIAELKQVIIKDGIARVGALVTHAELAKALREQCPALAEAAGQVGDPAVRNRGTIGGNVAHADPASDLPTVLTALGARFVVSAGGATKTIEAQDFFKGMMTTALDEHDLLVSIEVPTKQKGQGSAYAKFTHPASRYAVIGAAAVVTLNNGMCSAASVAVGGLVARPVRAAAVEKALIGQAPSADAIAKAAGEVAQDLGGDIIGDLYASAEYRKAVAPVWVKRAMTAAADRAR